MNARTEDPSPALVMRGVFRAVAFWAAAANLIGAVVIFVYLQFVSPGQAAVTAAPGHVRVVEIAFVLYSTATMIVGTLTIGSYARRWVSWLVGDVGPTDEEHRRTLQLPAFAAGTFFVLWLGAAVVFSALNMVLGSPARDAIRVAIGVVFAGMVTSALGFLAVERSFRPAIAAALVGREDTVSSRGLGIRSRLGLGWALGSGVPLLGVALAAASLSGVEWRLRIPIISLALLGLIAGGIMTTATANAVAIPLERLRSMVEAVRDGDLDVSVTIDDGGDIGLLQIGVNRMVEATRERLRVQDLFGRHVGAAVAQRAVEGGDALGSQATTASVLFADVIGSTRLAMSLPPAEVLEMLNRFFECVVEATGAEGGLVNKFAGDGALCVFGPPAGNADHAARALAAARRLHGLLDAQSDGDSRLDAAIGVSTGQVTAGNVGAADRFEYTVIGDPVNEASRLTELAKHRPGRVLTSSASIQAAGLREAERWQHVGAVELRGRGAPTDVYALAGAAATALDPVHRRRRRRPRGARGY